MVRGWFWAEANYTYFVGIGATARMQEASDVSVGVLPLARSALLANGTPVAMNTLYIRSIANEPVVTETSESP